MKNVKTDKLELEEIRVLGEAVLDEITKLHVGISQRNQNEYLNRLLLIDILQRLYYFFRTKVEHFKTDVRLPFSASEAVVLLQAFEDYKSGNIYNMQTVRKVKESIFKQLIDL